MGEIMSTGIYLGGLFVLVVLGVLIFKAEEPWELMLLGLLAILWPMVLPLGMVIAAGYLAAQGLKKAWAWFRAVGKEEAAFENRMEGRCHSPAPKPPQ